MSTRNPRINVLVEKSIYSVIYDMARRKGISMSMVVRDLIREALEIREDIAFSKFAEEREKTFDSSEALTHQQAWE